MYLKNIQEIINQFNIEIKNINSVDSFNKLKIKYLSRNGLINFYIKNINNIKDEDKKLYGILINDFKKKVADFFEKKNKEFSVKAINQNYDFSLPGLGINYGNQHILNKTLKVLENFFFKLGFELTEGNEIETEYYNFESLNMSKSHPSRNLNETFYISNNILLRTHTSNVQIHIIKNKKLPLKIISYGKVYRRDSDISHTPMFHQLEGFIIDKNISLSNLKFLLINFLNYYFQKKLKFRIRPSYFPFTEPSLEIDIECTNCSGLKCTTCKYTGWIEILGCGMIHPKILYNCNINYKNYCGFAFGLGIERITMIKHKITDLRFYYENNLDFLNQF